MLRPIFRENLDKLHWDVLSRQPWAVELLREHPDRIVWHHLAHNHSPQVLPLFEAKLDEYMRENRTEWWFEYISANPALVPLLERWPALIHRPALAKNPAAMHLLLQRKHGWWRGFCENSAALPLLEGQEHRMNRTFWYYLSRMPQAVPFLERHLDQVHWESVCGQPSNEAIAFLTRHQDRWANADNHWAALSSCPAAMPLLLQNMHRVNWRTLSLNPAAIHLLEENTNLYRVHWCALSANPAAVPLLMRNTRMINWNRVSGNPGAIELIEANLHKMNWKTLSANPAIFEPAGVEEVILK